LTPQTPDLAFDSLTFGEPYVIVFLARSCDSESCREFETVIFGA
jgi:hypothetical protein